MSKEDSTFKKEETGLNNKSDEVTSEVDDSLLPRINFSTFIFSLNSSALVQLGVLRDPTSGKKINNLILAKHTIDTLSMLKKKTEGNLNSEEFKMLSDILYDLKMMYVKQCK